MTGISLIGTTQAAAAYPEKPVESVVAYAPGGAVDVVARKMAQELSEQTGQQFIVENKEDFIAGLSAEPGGPDPAESSRLIRGETARWAKLAEKANIERQ